MDSEKIQRVGNSKTVGGDVLGVRNFLGSRGGADRLGGIEMTKTCHSEFAARNFALCSKNKWLG
ncbi:TPA: hypothetical protein ACQVJ5_002727 [Serratia marcescens]|uniref:hypothetical protein n=1 Tax=Serratia TaxID=613 RepID=UPI00254F025D|nr:hypothetical protein [Serratia nevei]MDK5933443.1 hypothetical protein [Serratia nevei]MEC5547244.1 hypothetical protein [Serratia nevei]MEC5626682.1 hypothetical protein [Serratia nevei]MEC5685084.1 hypothetical protein [Serratia nevei]MEC6068125.1 hypothetical protein [Serratia nevei]